MAQFVILMREDDGAWAGLPEAEQERLMGLYGAWVRELRTSGVLVVGAPFGAPGRILRGTPEGPVVEHEYDETSQVETGYFVVEAPDLAAAVKLARGCPALAHGESVVVRPIGHT